MSTAAALANAKMRAAAGWPLALLVIALYAPITGTVHLALLAASLFFLSRGAPTGHPKPAPSPTRKPPADRPRATDGKWTK